MSTAAIVWACVAVVVLVVLVGSGRGRHLRQLGIGFAVLVVAAVLIGGGYAFIAWRDGLLHVGIFDRLFGPR